MANSPHQPDAPPPPGAFDVPVAADSPTSFSSLSATAAAPAQTEPAPPVQRPGGAQPWIVGAGIAAAIVLSLVAIAVLYYKWYKTDEYPTTIIVWGEREWEGDTVTVSGSGLPTALTKDLTPNDGMVIRFHVPPGAYLVRVNDKGGRKIAERFTERPLSEQMIWWPFRRPPPPATQATAK